MSKKIPPAEPSNPGKPEAPRKTGSQAVSHEVEKFSARTESDGNTGSSIPHILDMAGRAHVAGGNQAAYDEVINALTKRTLFFWQVVPIIKKNLDTFSNDEWQDIQTKAIDRTIEGLTSGGAFNLRLFATDWKFLYEGLKGQKIVDLSNALVHHYLSAIKRGQLKDLIGIGEALEALDLTDVKVELADVQRFKFLLIHLPREFWKNLSGSLYASGGFLPIVQTSLPTYLQLGAPKRPALDEFQAEVLAIANQIQKGGNGGRLQALQRLVSATDTGIVQRVFDAQSPDDEARQVRGAIKTELVKKGELDQNHEGPLPIRYSNASARFRAAEEGKVSDRVGEEVQALEPERINAILKGPEALAEYHEKLRRAQAPLFKKDDASSNQIFERADCEVALRMMGRSEDDPGLQEYLRTVAKKLIQTYFPNTEITDEELNAILEMREVVMLLIGENPHMDDLTSPQRLDIFKPLGLGEGLEKLQVTNTDARKLLEYKTRTA